jgi:hypothetical protein
MIDIHTSNPLVLDAHDIARALADHLYYGEDGSVLDALAEVLTSRYAHSAEPGDPTNVDVDDLPSVESAQSFEDAGVMTTNAGLVLILSDGTEYQITVVRSR